MASVDFNSPGVSTREIDLSGPRTVEPAGIPAGIIGTCTRGPAFVPVTVATLSDFLDKFGKTDGVRMGPYAVIEWLRNAQAVTYLRVLGAGDGAQRSTSGNNQGNVTNAGFVVGQQLPNTTAGAFSHNPYANVNGQLGRVYFLGCYMSDSAGSSYLRDAGLQTGETGSVITRGIVMAPSGVILRLSSSQRGPFNVNNEKPLSDLIANENTTTGSITGSLVLSLGGVAKQEFTVLLNGHIPTSDNPNVITASFDPDALNYFPRVFNTDPRKIETAGHYLYAHFDVHPSQAVPTGSGILLAPSGSGGFIGLTGREEIAFLTTGSLARNSGSTSAPSFENWEDRFSAARTPYFTSQRFGGTIYDLFRVWAVSDGEGPSTEMKVSIENVTPSTDAANLFGRFDLVVRDYRDTDPNKRVLEAYRGVSLDPSSDRYVAKVIGDQRVYFDFDKRTQSQKLVVDGDYEARSNRVRVEISSRIKNDEVPHDALPVGFRGLDHLVTSGSAPLATLSSSGFVNAAYSTNVLNRAVQPPAPLRQHIKLGDGTTARASTDLYWGVQFEIPDSAAQPNKSVKPNATVAGYARKFPTHQTAWANVSTGSNAGAVDTAANGIIDADRFLNNRFTLENVRVQTGSDGKADLSTAKDWAYVRAGTITTDDTNKLRAFSAASDLDTPERRAHFKFSAPMQGGFDGTNIFWRSSALLLDTAVREEMDNTNRGLADGPTVSAFRKGLQIMKNTADVDVKLLAVPGMRHPAVTDEALLATKDRFDALYLMDVEVLDNLNTDVTASDVQTVSVKNTVSNFKARALDNSFGAVYFPDAVVRDEVSPEIGNVQVPASVVALGAYALNDRIGREWLAPAGKKRGKTSAIETSVQLSRANLDSLYDADINPLVARPGDDGVLVWGQKTLQLKSGVLDRVSARRLLINIRRQVREAANRILFEPNRAATLERLKNAIEPRLEQIRKEAGLERHRVTVDATTTTQADVEANIIRGRILIMPTRTAEFISLDFVVTNAGVQV